MALAASSGGDSAEIDPLFFILGAVGLALVIAVWFKTRPKSQSHDLDDNDLQQAPAAKKKSRGGELPLLPDAEPFRLPSPPPPHPDAVIVPETCRTCAIEWCNYPEVRKMEITNFKDEREFMKLSQNSYELEDLPLLKEDGTLIDAIAPRNRYAKCNVVDS